MKLYGLRNDACFSFRNVAKLYGLRNNACFEGPEGNKQGSKVDHKCPWMKLGYDTPNYMPPTMHMPNENANRAVPVIIEGQQP